MQFEQKGNLGRVDLLMRHLTLNYSDKVIHKEDDDTVDITKEELFEIMYQLQQFNYLLSNSYLNKNSLQNNAYTGLVSVLDEQEPLYRNYSPDTAKEVKYVF